MNRKIASNDFSYPSASGPNQVDLDRDGEFDQVHLEPGGAVTITSADGVRTFAIPGTRLWAGGFGTLGERVDHELVVFTVGGERTLPTGHAWVVPITPAVGTTSDPRAVGIDTGDGNPFPDLDRDGDGVPDQISLSFPDGDDINNGTTRLISGAAIAAAKPGTALPASATIATIPGALDGFTRLDGEPGPNPGFPPGQRIITRSFDASGATLRIYDGRTIKTFTTAPEAFRADRTERTAFVAVWTADDGIYLSLSVNPTGTSPHDVNYWWKIDECAPLTAGAGTAGSTGSGTATPAAPVSGGATFTG